MVFPSVFLFCKKKKKKIKTSHGLYGVKRKFRPIYTDETTILHGLCEGKLFSKVFCAILTKISGVSIFVRISHCPMDYCIPPYFTVFIEQGFACNSVE